MDTPLFPLHTVLFPEGSLPLRVFEPRYLDMVSNCLKSNGEFGVVLITEGRETGVPAKVHEIGTLARISDWRLGRDGLLEIACRGGRRFRILRQEVTDTRLITAEVELLPEPPRVAVPECYRMLVDQLRSLIRRMGGGVGVMQPDYNDAAWVSFRLAELMPLRLDQRQYILQLDDPVRRLRVLRDLLEQEESA